MIKVKGLWVSPIAIENGLIEHEPAREAAVVGVPDEIDGTAVKAPQRASEADGATVPIVYEGRTTRGGVADADDIDEFIDLYGLTDYAPEMREMAAVAVEAAELSVEAMPLLRDLM